MDKGLLDLGFSEEFAQAIALGILPKAEVCKNFGVSKEQYKALIENKYFRARVAEYRTKASEEGVTTRMKADAILDSLLIPMRNFVLDEENADASRVAMIGQLREMSSLKHQKQELGGGVSIQINLQSEGSARTIEAHVAESDNESVPKITLNES
jgi:hypothetical protein